MPPHPKKENWHVGKEIPIATIAVLIIQTVGVIWLAASTVAKVDFLKEIVATQSHSQIVVDARQDNDLRHSEEIILARLDKVDSKLDRIIESKK